MRDSIWLEVNLRSIWNRYFSDIPLINPIAIRFGKRSAKRLGSIVLTKENVSLITITAFFKDETVPDVVVYETIAHELIHYIHGFSSKHERKFKHPHQGGIIHKEMENRGLGEVHKNSKEWMNTNWSKYIKDHIQRKKAKKRRVTITITRRQLLRSFFKKQ